jgi:type I restriction enzyme S subunit
MPESWDVKQIEKVCEVGGGGTPDKNNKDYWGGEIPWLSPKDFEEHHTRISDTEDYITKKGAENSATKIYDPGTTAVVTRSGILRRYLPVVKLNRTMAVNQDIKTLHPDEELVDPDYLFQAISTEADNILGRCRKIGTTVESIETPLLKKYPLRIPPLEEQRTIAEIGENFDGLIYSKIKEGQQYEVIGEGLQRALIAGDIRVSNKPIEIAEEVRVNV